MNTVTRGPSAGVGPAHATLLTLKAALQVGSGDYETIVLLPDRTPLSVEKVALRLAQLPKPLYCGAVLRERVLTVECHHRAPPETVTSYSEDIIQQQRYREWMASEIAVNVENVMRAHGERPGQPSVLLRGHDESLVLSLDEYQEWLRDYMYLVNVARASYDTDEHEARARGAAIMYRVGPSGMPLL